MFFFKHKTAYEMRISDWSSDVCSSDLSRENGLQNNTVLSLCEDQQQNLWLGLDNGIDYITLDQHFSYYQDGPGLLGSVYDAALFDGQLYLGTNHGIFRRDTPAAYNQIGSASCRERVCQYVSISVVAVSLKT